MTGKISIKAGLEIHQQLDAGKLFCSCPAILRKDNPDYQVVRELHAVAGETGEIDEAVKFESEKKKKFIYEGYYDNTCLVELDEEPPHEINKEALKIAIQISLLLNCEIVPYTQIMRKTVINGSNTSGFQRTMLLARKGYVDTSFGKVPIDYVFLEEDSARPSASNEEDDPELEDSKKYKLDRLGIPLVEIVTGIIDNPDKVKETALLIGEILRACKVRRGLGTIRQDLNISIEGSERVEIKGFQDPRIMIKTIEMEIERQKKCLEDKTCKKEVRKSNEDGSTSFLRPMPGSSRMYPETDLPLIHVSREEINDAKKDLPKLKSEIKDELKKHGLNEELIKLILSSNKLQDFQELIAIYNKPDLVGKMVTLWKKELENKLKLSENEVDEKLSLDVLESILQAIPDKISENEVYDVMKEILEGKEIKEALKREKVDNIEEEIMKLIKEKPGLSENAYMGLVMQKFKGKINGKEVMNIIKKLK